MRNIPEDNLAYPILLKFDTGVTGSGFLLKTVEKIYFITARHVLFKDEEKKIRELNGHMLELICPPRSTSDSSVSRYIIDTKEAIILQHDNADIAAIEIGTLKVVQGTSEAHEIESSKGIKLVEKSVTWVVNTVAGLTTKFLAEVLIGNDVILYGYPTSLWMQQKPQFDYNKPLLRKGIIANVYPDKGTIILDCPVYYWNSGWPAVEIEIEISKEGYKIHHKVIGVVSQFIPFVEQWINTKNGLTNTELSNSWYSVVVSMDKVFELISYSKAKD